MFADIRYGLDTLGFYRRRRDSGQSPFSACLTTGDFWGSGEPELIRQIFAAPPDVFGKPKAPELLEPLLGARSILLLGGEEHRRDRALLMPPFHGERMRAYGKTIAESTLARARAALARETVSISELMERISLDSIVEAVFGVFDSERAEFEGHVLRAVQRFTVPIMFLPFLHVKLLGLGPWDRFVRARARLDERLHELISARRAASARGDDILSLLLEARYEDGAPIGEAHLRDELVTMIMAGHETTAIALSWTIDHLLRSPKIAERLREELDAVDPAELGKLAELTYLGAVCAEGLRLHPVVPDVTRFVEKSFDWGGQRVEAGEQIAVAICLLHEDPGLYPEPQRFRPERFLERAFKPWEYCPFGGGHRRCLGAAFALYEMRVVLATLFRHFDFELIEPVPPRLVRRNVTMGPDSKIPVRIRRR